MSDEHRDPSGNTQAFRAFVARDEPEPAARRSNAPLIGGGVAVLVALFVVVYLLLS